MDAYEMLGLPEDATPDEVRLAFRALARKHHPDHQQSAERRRDAEVRMQQINEARKRALQGIDERTSRGGPRQVVVPLQRTGSPRDRSRAAHEVYGRVDDLVVPRAVPAAVESPSGWRVALVPLGLALAAGLALATDAPRAMVLALLGLIVLASAVSLW